MIFCSADRAPRQHVGIPQPVVIWLPPGNAEELSSVPLPDLVQSTMEQLPPPSPQVTASVPSSPMRDATFQFPECSVNGNIVPLPSPRPLPRRRLASEGSSLRTLRSETRQNEGNTSNTCCCYPSQNERQSWTNMGTNLRNIAGDFHACKTKVSVLTHSHIFRMKNLHSTVIYRVLYLNFTPSFRNL